MKPEKIKQLLPLVGSKAIGSRTGWVLATCPMRWNHGSEPSSAFAVSNHPKKKSRCKCLSCGYSGDLTDLLLDIRFGLRKNPDYAHYFKLQLAAPIVAAEFEEMELTDQDIPSFEAKSKQVQTVFPTQWLASFKPAVAFPEAVKYCSDRMVMNSTLIDLDVRYDPQQQRIGFPFRNFKGELMGMQGRYIGSEPVKDDKHDAGVLRYFQYGYQGKRNMHCWMGENQVNLDEPVVLVEGPFDFARVYQHYENVLASFTSGLSMTKVKRISDADSIITFYDHGKGGDAARLSIRKYLPGYPIVDLIPTQKEGDAGASSPERIREQLLSAGLSESEVT